MDTEKLLTRLFDYQRFEGDPALQRVIDEVGERLLGDELSSDELSRLSAAGDPYLQIHDPNKKEGPS